MNFKNIQICATLKTKEDDQKEKIFDKWQKCRQSVSQPKKLPMFN